MRTTTRFLLPLLLLFAACGPEAPKNPEILWDEWGVPHVYAGDEAHLFHAYGWAQMKSHGDLVLRLYGEARGRGAEHWGADHLDGDRWVRTLGIPERAAEWYAAQSPDFRRNLDAFAGGVNEFAETHPEEIADDVRAVLPVTGVDVMAHAHSVVHGLFVADRGYAARARARLAEGGSNAWAVAPARAASGHALLLANPHLPWQDLFLFYEAHLVGPGVDFYGATLVGFPVPVIGFNDRLGWTHTVNTFDGADAYELQLAEGGYLFDGETVPFDAEEQTILVKEDDGTLREEPLTIERSRHGPVIAKGGGRAVALAVTGLDQPGMLAEWWDLARAANLLQFETVLKRLQIPMFNVVYADREGNVLYFYGGRVPRKPAGDYAFWETGAADGTTSSTLWTGTLAYDELPRVLNPPSGWVQNANDPPWTSTDPPTLDPDAFPAYLAPQAMHFRAQRSASLLAADESITFDELVDYKHSTRMLLADRLLDDLVAAVEGEGGERARAAAAVLAAWDRQADAGSRGAALFYQWTLEMGLDRLLRQPYGRWAEGTASRFAAAWDPAAPLTTPDGLPDPAAAVAALERAAAELEETYGSTEVAWGDVYRLRVGDRDLPASGGPGDPTGIFRTLRFRPDDDEKYRAVTGDSFYLAVEFSEPPRARVLLAYGNASRQGSPHHGDQLELFARQEMRPVWRTREEVEAHLEARTAFSLF